MNTRHPYAHATPSNRPNQLSAARFVRTHSSSRAAFPMHCEYACAVQRFARRGLTIDERVALWALACGAAGAFVLGVWG